MAKPIRCADRGRTPPRAHSFHLVLGRPLELLSRLLRRNSSAASAWLPALAAPTLFLPPRRAAYPLACHSSPSTLYPLPSSLFSTAMASESRRQPPGSSQLVCSTPPGSSTPPDGPTPPGGPTARSDSTPQGGSSQPAGSSGLSCSTRTTHRGLNITPAEDLALARSWVSVSESTADMDRDLFWTRVRAVFVQQPEAMAARTTASLRSRFSTQQVRNELIHSRTCRKTSWGTWEGVLHGDHVDRGWGSGEGRGVAGMMVQKTGTVWCSPVRDASGLWRAAVLVLSPHFGLQKNLSRNS